MVEDKGKVECDCTDVCNGMVESKGKEERKCRVEGKGTDVCNGKVEGKGTEEVKGKVLSSSLTR